VNANEKYRILEDPSGNDWNRAVHLSVIDGIQGDNEGSHQYYDAMVVCMGLGVSLWEYHLREAFSPMQPAEKKDT
jgi:hypothetical protein